MQAIETSAAKPARVGLAAELKTEAVTVGAMAADVTLIILLAANLFTRWRSADAGMHGV